MNWNTISSAILPYLRAFLVGGGLCVIAQILIDKTKMTPARILVAYVVAGVILGAIGVYQPLADFGGAGATVPLTGFGYLISKGVKEAIELTAEWYKAYASGADVVAVMDKQIAEMFA